MKFLSARETRVALPMSEAIRAMRRAFAETNKNPLRQLVGNSFVMPGRVGDDVAVKIVSTVPGNPAGIVVAFDRDGTPVGAVDGPTITAIRTAAGAGLATDLLAPESASSMAMIGAGAMARDQIAAIAEVRTIERIAVWSRDLSRAGALADQVGGKATATPTDAIADADIVTTATPARAPLFEDAALMRDVHVNAIGAFTPEMAEIPSAFVNRAFVVVDDLEAAAAEAGDLIQAGREPDLDMNTLLAMSAVHGHRATMFKSVGVATQDVTAAVTALKNAQRMGLGTEV